MTQQLAITVHAEGEVRDKDGNLIETVHSLPEGTTVEVAGATYTADANGDVQIPVDTLTSFTDDQLRAAGLDEPTIAQIRSTP
jgi:hypothetical protein